MPSKKEVKELTKDLVLAIEWAAAEYKYAKELRENLAIIEKIDKSMSKRVKKAVEIVRYLSIAERRTDRFEERARKKIEEFSEELGKQMNENFTLGDTITFLKALAKELEIEHAHLVKFPSINRELMIYTQDKLQAEVELEMRFKHYAGSLIKFSKGPDKYSSKEEWSRYRKANDLLVKKKAEEVSASILQSVKKMEVLLDEAIKWISALEVSLKRAREFFEQNMQKITKENNEGLDILHQHRWPLEDLDPRTLFLVQQSTSDLKNLAKKISKEYYVGYGKSLPLFSISLLALIDLLVEDRVTWEQVVKDLPQMCQAAAYPHIMFERDLAQVKLLINKETWSFFAKYLPTTLDGDFVIRLNGFRNTFGGKYLEIYQKLAEAGFFKYFKNVEEIVSLVKFMGNLRREVLASKIDFVYSIDRSGRILGFLFYHVLRNLGESRNIKFYFVNATRQGQITFYSEKQKKEIVGKNVLVIDDFVHTGGTMHSIRDTMYSVVGSKGRIILYTFGLARGWFNNFDYNETFHAVYSQEPSWYKKKAYSGMQEKPHGGVEVDKGAQEIARAVRKSLLVLAEIIAKSLKV